MAIKSIVGEKSLAFGKRIAKCYRYLRYSKKEHILSDQLLRVLGPILERVYTPKAEKILLTN